MMRFLAGSAVLVLVCTLPAQADRQSDTEKRERPNIILIMADDLGWGDVGFNGNQTIETPHLDALAKSGLQLNRFYAASAVCSPTRGSALTGKNPIRLGIPSANRGHLKAREQTLAEILRGVGYRTGHFGKWHLGTLTKTVRDANRGGARGVAHYSTPQDNGFDVCFATESKVPTFDPLLRPKGIKRKTWWDPAPKGSETTAYGTAYWDHHGKAITENTRGDDSRVIMDRVIPFVQDAVKQKTPFFSVVWFHAPHLPVVASDEQRARYKGHTDYEKNYYGCITALDQQVGRLCKELDSLGVEGDTMIWFCSDNGPEGKATAPGSAGSLRGRKRSLYEGGVRVPAFVVWPARIEAGRHSSLPAVTSDYLPTIATIVGVDLAKEQHLDGIDLGPLLVDTMKERGSAIGFEFGRQASLVDDRWKLYAKLPKRGAGKAAAIRYELYDIPGDPNEDHDVAHEHPDLVANMARNLAQWRDRCLISQKGDGR